MISPSLKRAARAYGIALPNNGMERQSASIEIVKKMVLALSGTDNMEEAWKIKRDRAIQQGMPDFIIAWDGVIPDIWMWADKCPESLSVAIIDQQKVITAHKANITETFKRKNGFRIKLAFGQKVELGYYDIEINGKRSFLISAPYRLDDQDMDWGIFAPVHALSDSDQQEIGNFRHLSNVSKFVYSQGGRFVGTLPLLASRHDENAGHSPYSPVSRLFWDEIYLDTDNLPGYDYKSNFQSSNDNLVDYQNVYALKKTTIKNAAQLYFQRGDTSALSQYISETPYLEEFAEFKSKGDQEEKNYHLYAQFACHLQIMDLRKEGHADLYLDYPVGVHPDGFDAVHFKDLFIPGFSVGAPADALAGQGQNWGLLAVNPVKMIEDRFSYIRDSLHNHLKYAHRLRIDHVMGLYRLYCIPNGQKENLGVYIHYPFKALMAIFLLEARRHGALLIGENLGTVPDTVNDSMVAHSLLRMWIAQFSLTEDPERTFDSIEYDMIASVNTHDIFPFEAFINGKDLEQMKEYGVISSADTMKIAKERSYLKNWQKHEQPYLKLVEGMAKSPARSVIVNMEDIWGETLPQNIPGTTNEYPNWKKKFSQPIEKWASNNNIRQAFSLLNQYRKKK